MGGHRSLSRGSLCSAWAVSWRIPGGFYSSGGGKKKNPCNHTDLRALQILAERFFPFPTPHFMKLGEVSVGIRYLLGFQHPCAIPASQSRSRDGLALQWRGQDGFRVILFPHPPPVTPLAFAHLVFCH